MNNEQLDVGGELRREREDVEIELKIWDTHLTSLSKMAFISGSESLQCYGQLRSVVPEWVFEGFRTAAMGMLKNRLAEIDAEFERL